MGNLVKSVGNALGLSTPKVNQGAFGPGADESAYIDQLQGFASGNAPSAAQIQMQQGIQQASQQAQALAASQRGISPALAARYAAMAQAGLSQGAAAQGAMLRANEQQNYMGMLGNELQSVRTGQMQGALAQNANENAAAGRMSGLLGSVGGALIGGGSSKATAGGGQEFTGSKMFAGNPMQAQNFQGTGMAEGGEVSPDGPQSHTVQFLTQALNGGGPVMDYQSGGKIPGQATVQGDNIQNDVVPIMASPGEIMLPRSVTMGKNPGEKAKAFVDKIKASQKKAN